MHPTLRIGIVGAGYIGGVHSAGYRAAAGSFPDAVPPVELVRVADADAARAVALASSWGWAQTTGDWRAVTRADDVDVVDVCAPNHLHAEIALDALAHGKHVICEKPLASDLDEARAMAQAAQASDRLAQVCFYYRTWPAVAWARELVAAGAIGRPVHLRGWMLQDYAADPHAAMGWRASAAEGGAGALDDLGSHIVDVARALCGEIDAVTASCRSTVARTDAPPLVDLVGMLVDFASGASGTIEASWALTGHSCDLGFDLVGDEGALRFSWERANELHVQRAGADGFERVLLGASHPRASAFVGVPGQQMGYRDAFTIGLAELLAAVAAGAGAASPSFEDGLRTAEIVAAARASSATRTRAAVPAPGDR